MPVTPNTQRRENLDRLLGSLSGHCTATSAQQSQAQDWAQKMPLSHATPFGKLQSILRNTELRSQVELGIPHGDAETLTGTIDDVFLYVGAFSYPGTECGFLFMPSAESAHVDDGVATPFDSGALAYKIPVPAGYTDGPSFVRAHELPISNFRQLLASVIVNYAETPETYLHNPDSFSCSCKVQRTHPFNLTGTDRRGATFEVRLPKRVPLSPPHLRAIFVREGFETPELSVLHATGVSIERFEPSGADFFYALRNSCINFIQTHLIP